MLKLKNDIHKSLYDLDVNKDFAIDMSKRRQGMKISLFSDSMMKAMFQNNNRIKYSVKFLSYFLDYKYEELLQSITLVKNELDKDKEYLKSERADYVARLDDTIISIEVNNNSSVDTMRRNIDYATKHYREKVRKGDKEYNYQYVIQFNLNNFSFVGHDKIIDIYGIQNDDCLRLDNNLIFVQIYVPNLRKKWYHNGVNKLTECEKYILPLVEENIEKLKEFGDEDIIMDEYIKEAVNVSFEDGVGESYDKEWALKDQATRDGLEQGIEQGSLAKSKEIAKLLLEEGIDINIISKTTGLSVEEINKL